MTQTIASKLIRFGHSPDPDDAFMFYAFAKETLPMQGFRVEHVIEDIETLNQRAMQSGAFRETPLLEVTAVSCHAYAYLSDKYAIMKSGASVGDKYGPILVARRGGVSPPMQGSIAAIDAGRGDLAPTQIQGKKIAVPGKLTTAYLVLQLFGEGFTPVFTPFDQILDAVRTGQVDLGLVIHEGQITYQDHGLEKVADLGEWWHDQYKLPLPLGIDVIRRDLGAKTMQEFSRLFKASIQYALDHRAPALEYARQYGRGISEQLNDRFVGMYVNDYTLDLGPRGEAGLRKLYELAYSRGIISSPVQPDFV